MHATGWGDDTDPRRAGADLTWRPPEGPRRSVHEPTIVVPGPAAVPPRSHVGPGPVPTAWPPGPAPRRRWLSVPLAVAAVGFVSAEPLVGVPLLGLLGGPALATVGDALAHPDRHPAWVLAWWPRNVGRGLARSLGGLVVLAVTLGLWFVTRAIDLLGPASPWVLRVGGALAALAVLAPIGRGGPTYRSDAALDAGAARLAPGGRPTVGLVVVVVACVAVTCLGMALDPEAWPLR